MPSTGRIQKQKQSLLVKAGNLLKYPITFIIPHNNFDYERDKKNRTVKEKWDAPAILRSKTGRQLGSFFWFATRRRTAPILREKGGAWGAQFGERGSLSGNRMETRQQRVQDTQRRSAGGRASLKKPGSLPLRPRIDSKSSSAAKCLLKEKSKTSRWRGKREGVCGCGQDHPLKNVTA